MNKKIHSNKLIASQPAPATPAVLHNLGKPTTGFTLDPQAPSWHPGLYSIS